MFSAVEAALLEGHAQHLALIALLGVVAHPVQCQRLRQVELKQEGQPKHRVDAVTAPNAQCILPTVTAARATASNSGSCLMLGSPQPVSGPGWQRRRSALNSWAPVRRRGAVRLPL